MPLLDERTRLRREIEHMAIGDSVFTGHGLLVRRVANTRFEVSCDRQKLVVGGCKAYRRHCTELLYDVADAVLHFDERRLESGASAGCAEA